jgi:hypothetical protein
MGEYYDGTYIVDWPVARTTDEYVMVTGYRPRVVNRASTGLRTPRWPAQYFRLPNGFTGITGGKRPIRSRKNPFHVIERNTNDAWDKLPARLAQLGPQPQGLWTAA